MFGPRVSDNELKHTQRHIPVLNPYYKITLNLPLSYIKSVVINRTKSVYLSLESVEVQKHSTF